MIPRQHFFARLVSILASPLTLKHLFTMKQCLVAVTFNLIQIAWSYSAISRRSMIHRAALVASISTAAASPAVAASSPNPRDALLEAQSTLSILLENWQRATVDCTFADVPRDLLEQKNKQLLLEKASTYALFDKSVSVETCKTTNRIVRDYLGLTGKGPLVGIDKKLKLAMDNVNVDQLEQYIEEMEYFQQSMARAASLSYTAGTADFDSVNNFAKDDKNRKEDSNLEQARRAIVDAKANLDHMVGMLDS